MHDPTQSEQIDAIIDGLLGPRKVSGLGGILSSSLPRLDTSRPNIHESKKEFLRERDTVTSIIEHLEAVIEQVIHKQGDDEHEQMIGRLHVAINIGAVKLQRYNQIASASVLAIRNTIDTGFYYNSLYVVIEMINVYNERLKELQDQEKEFWSVPHRAPNYYARTIALRFARLYASEKQERPTFGISREGNGQITSEEMSATADHAKRMKKMRMKMSTGETSADGSMDDMDHSNPTQEN